MTISRSVEAAAHHRGIEPLARAGYATRGIAALIFYGGLRYSSVDGGSTPGLADALKAVQGFSFGWVVLLLIALGLVAFGLYSLAAARYRRMVVS